MMSTVIPWNNILTPSPMCILFVSRTHTHSRFESKEVKMIRVAVSSFYDYLALVIKTMQEFDTTMEHNS